MDENKIIKKKNKIYLESRGQPKGLSFLKEELKKKNIKN